MTIDWPFIIKVLVLIAFALIAAFVVGRWSGIDRRRREEEERARRRAAPQIERRGRMKAHESDWGTRK